MVRDEATLISAEWKRAPLLSPQSSQAQRALVGRVLASGAFAQSKRLSSLLAYLCDMVIAGRADELNEQHVGEAVFSRARDYDTMADSIVRTQASRLRSRLDMYFDGEGSHEPVRITIPRGIYAPHFEPQRESPSSSASSTALESTTPVPYSTSPIDLPQARPTDEVAKSRNQPLRSLRLAWTVAACALLGLIGLVVLNRGMRTDHSSRSAVPSPDHPLWSQLFLPGQATLLVPGDSSLVIYQGIKGRNLTLDEYISGSYRDFRPTAPGLDQTSPVNLASRRYTSIVDLEVAAELSRLAQQRGSTLDVRYPRELRANDLKQGTIVIVGANEADPWINLFERNMNFVFANDRDRNMMSVYNRVPRGNEPKQWDSMSLDPQHRVYSVVAWLPNLSGNGRVLIVEGTTMAGTECAWDFVNDDSRLKSFLRGVRRPDGTLPSFELLLEASNIAGSASQSSILAYRVH